MRFFLLIILVVLLVVLATITAGCRSENGDDTPDVNSEAECNSDGDCATAGCSGQLCVKAEDAAGIITTCEYKEEYRCLQLTSCGCNDGSCGWAQTDEYISCLKDYQKK
ncbi:eight-cysteine-cluster domain-containing protein [Candidatus Woesearchaeota archaeon]|nr:eight-cysteine-cluster domain-containing protein [Candidatus Woesearchaeota archaeon]